MRTIIEGKYPYLIINAISILARNQTQNTKLKFTGGQVFKNMR